MNVPLRRPLRGSKASSPSYRRLYRAHRGPRTSAFHEITGLKSCLQTSVLCQGPRAVFMSPCRCLTETWKVGSEGSACSWPLLVQ